MRLSLLPPSPLGGYHSAGFCSAEDALAWCTLSSISFELTVRHRFRQSFKELLDITCSKLEGVGMVIDSSVGVELLCRVLWQYSSWNEGRYAFVGANDSKCLVSGFWFLFCFCLFAR